MKKFLIIILSIQVIYNTLLYSKEMVSIKCIAPHDTCKLDPNIWILDLNTDNRYDACLYRTCGGLISNHNLMDNSTALLNNDITAFLINGLVETKNFQFYFYDPNKNNFICKLYYDSNYQCSVLIDYTRNENQTINYEEADEYFFTQQFGSLFIITKKTDINVQLVMLCSIDGRIITYLQNVEVWQRFVFDLYEQSSGIYFIHFIAPDKSLTKKIIYLR
ncbi:MAG: T9SS type A sorting domain-containing protein [Bacteroidetes bacterium]|nr:MAG: T9SS type A sorting domain-containing protein [Bacteroidota bacterium]